ncbi:jg5968 [Pararge aegeria aegeria]|uniref:Jg5968 protein n=1 Tax=Pararge aegeria aegeria TaxID=348720 RepID=A0A8S4RFA1_9NEOP|nr:jg5968 [Pararge aegeria aegeria]
MKPKFDNTAIVQDLVAVIIIIGIVRRAKLEPPGLLRDDGKSLDGMTIVPWSMGRALVWDTTCVDTLAASHLPSTSQKAAAAAESTQMLKRRKYSVICNDEYE